MRCPSFRLSGIRMLNYQVHVVARSSAQPHALDSSTFGFHSIENSDTSCFTNCLSNLCVIPKDSDLEILSVSMVPLSRSSDGDPEKALGPDLLPKLPPEIQKLYEKAYNGGTELKSEDDDEILRKYSKKEKKVFIKNFVIINSGEEDLGLYGRLEDITKVRNGTREENAPDVVALCQIIGEVWVKGEKRARFSTVLPVDNHWWVNDSIGFSSSKSSTDKDGKIREIWYYLSDPHSLYKKKFDNFCKRFKKSEKAPDRRAPVVSEVVAPFQLQFEALSRIKASDKMEEGSAEKEYKELAWLRDERKRRCSVAFDLSKDGTRVDEWEVNSGGSEVEEDEVMVMEEVTGTFRVGDPVRKVGHRLATYLILGFEKRRTEIRAHLLKFILTEEDQSLILGFARDRKCHLCTARQKKMKERIPEVVSVLGPFQTFLSDLYGHKGTPELFMLLGGEEYRAGDCILLAPGTLDRKAKAPSRYWMKKEKLEENLKEYVENKNNRFPEFHRWTKTDFPQPSVRPLQAARITGLAKDGDSVIVKLELFYRLSDTSHYSTFAKLLRSDHTHELLLAEEDTHSLTLTQENGGVIMGRCYVKAVDDSSECQDWLLGGPNRFFCRRKVEVREDGEAVKGGWVSEKEELVVEFNRRAERAPDNAKLQDHEKLPTLEVFSGAGGLAEGLRQSGVSDAKWAIEHTPSAADTFRQNFKGCQVFEKDANVLLHERLEANEEGIAQVSPDTPILPEPHEVRMIVGGPPCQGFSGLNQNKDTKKSKDNIAQVFMFLSMVDEYRPEVFLLENVANFGTGKMSGLSGVGSAVVLCLLELGYQVNFACLQAGAYGVPQSRTRFFIMAVAPWVKLPEFPEPIHCFGEGEMCRLFSHLIRDAEDRASTDARRNAKKKKSGGVDNWKKAGSAPYRKLVVWEALSDLPKLDDGHGIFDGQYADDPKTFFQIKMRGNCESLVNHESQMLPIIKKVRVEEIPKCHLIPGANWHFMENVERQYETAQNEKLWTKVLEYRFPSGKKDNQKREIMFFPSEKCRRPKNKGGCEWGTCKILNGAPSDSIIPRPVAHKPIFHQASWRRVNPGSHCNTMVTNADPDGKTGTVLHYSQDRILTPRECARLMGFPDSFVFQGDFKDQHEQIGNAVPPPLAEALGRAIKACFIKENGVSLEPQMEARTPERFVSL